MFTGIVTHRGVVRSVEPAGDTVLEIATDLPLADAPPGASIACAGCCLTVIDKGPDWFRVTVSAETLAHTTIGTWSAGSVVNLERALRLGDELGGHLVSGHVDGVATVALRRPEGDSLRLDFVLPERLARFVAPKGSVAVDGVSLTVNEVDGARFGVNIIPHTRDRTTLGGLAPGARVNIEIDLVARYVARLIGKDGP